MDKPTKLITATDIEDLLRNRFCPPAWAFIPQVRNGTGYLRTTRTADALAMGLWPSRGLHLNGFEIKVNRGDWLNEIGHPAKAEEIAQFCDFWWVVAPKDIIKVEEVPKNWGLMIPFGDTTKIIRDAQQLKPGKIDKLFLAAILRRVQETIAPEVKIKEALEAGKKQGEESAKSQIKYANEREANLREDISRFEKASGVNINPWHAEDIGNAVKAVLNGEHLRIRENLEHLLVRAKEIVTDLEDKLKQD